MGKILNRQKQVLFNEFFILIRKLISDLRSRCFYKRHHHEGIA